MKVHFPPQAVLSPQQLKACDEYCKKYISDNLAKEQKDVTRRILKLTCIALNQQFGFGGKSRLAEYIKSVNALCAEAESDEIFWFHVDTALAQIGMDFIPESDDFVSVGDAHA